MKAKITIGICLMLVLVGCLSGCVEQTEGNDSDGYEYENFTAKILQVDYEWSGGVGFKNCYVSILFDNGRLVIIKPTDDLLFLNRTGNFSFRIPPAKYYPLLVLIDVEYLEEG